MAHSTQSVLELFDLESPYVTEYRRLLYRITNHSSRSEIKTVMVTSSMVAEGKSTTCAFLALTASMKKGLKTLIVDADLRLPSVARMFDLPPGKGLVDILVDGYNPKDAIRKTDVPNLDILTSGEVRTNPTEIFDAEAIGQLLDEMKFYYDLILVDCAPLLPVSDPMLLAPSVDGVLLVIKAGGTQKEVVQRAVEILDPKRNNVLGVALNNMNHSLPYYYDYDYYQYDYHQRNDKKQQNPGGDEKQKKENRKAEQQATVKDNISPNN